MSLKYKAYIAANSDTRAFDQTGLFDNPKSALKSIKARNPRDWRDCVVWVVYIPDNGEEEVFTDY